MGPLTSLKWLKLPTLMWCPVEITRRLAEEFGQMLGSATVTIRPNFGVIFAALHLQRFALAAHDNLKRD